jgi:formylglycine-generating enzyme required for sulfatase activity
VSGFRLDKYLVTVGRFRQFVAAWNHGSGYLPAAGAGKHTHLNRGQGLTNVGASMVDERVYETGWLTSDDAKIATTDANLACTGVCVTGGTLGGYNCSDATWTAMVAGQENLPINCVNWYEAYAFCIWDGGFLPSEAEWEYAAAGGGEQRLYPWGSADPGTTNQYAIYDCNYPRAMGRCVDGVTNMAPVGTATLGAGLWGQLDLAGETWEWNLDGYATYVNPCTDCAYLESAAPRVARGGFFGKTWPNLWSAYRYNNGIDPVVRAQPGIRCARAP